MLDSGCNDAKRLLKRGAFKNWLPESDRFLRHLVEHPVSGIFKVDHHDLECVTRGRAPIAFARQVAMYLAHITLGLDFTAIGRLYGRDRTTVAHACLLVEERRENPYFDEALVLLEQAIRMTAVRAAALN